MKNTMKIKSLLSFFVPAAVLSLGVASCSDYDNGYTEGAIKFTEDFRKAFGDIDPEQDWNLAERASVTVSTMKESDVKIYALMGDEYCIVGHYEGVKGTQVLGFDMVEGTKSIMVSDGQTAEKTVPGGVVTFGGTRTVINNGQTINGVTINRIEDENGVTLDNDVTYPKYKYITAADYTAMTNVIPELIVHHEDETNLDKVPHDFTFVSNGSFIIYPYYWNTSSINTIGVYYYEGNTRVERDIYTIKKGTEMQYLANDGEQKSYAGSNGKVFNNWNDGPVASGNATVWKQYNVFTWKDRNNNQVGKLGLPTGNLLNQGYTKLTITASMKQKTNQYRILFYNNTPNPNGGYNNYPVIITQSGTVTIDLSTIPSEYITDCREICLSGGNYDSNDVTFTDDGGNSVIGDVAVTEMYLTKYNWQYFRVPNDDVSQDADKWGRCTHLFESTSETNGIGATSVRGQGIKVDIHEGVEFGMYLKKADGTTFYSESRLNNNKDVHGPGVTDDGTTINWHDTSINPSYASKFNVGDQMFLGFEDWPNKNGQTGESDFDLNDVVLAFDGNKPTLLNQDPTPGGTWLIASEDLGGSFDVDYNDIVFKVEHLSGMEYANVTPLAAGGTLASYIFFIDPMGSTEQCLGEIHQMFNKAPQVSGEYEPINAGVDRAENRGTTISIKVNKDWTMAYYSTETWHNNAQYNYENVNMGGFEIRTLRQGTEAPTGNVTVGHSAFTGASRIQPPNDKGMAPYVLCLPYYYTRDNMNGYTVENGKLTKYVWAWPAELVTICDANGVGPYPKFKDWVADKNNNDWYMYKNSNGNTVSDLYWVSDMSQEENNSQENGNSGNENVNNNGVYLVNSNEVCRFTFQNNGTTYALAYDENQSANGSLVIRELDNNDPDQIWRIETTPQNDSNYGYLYNYGAGQRIEVDRNSSPYKAGWTESTALDAMSGRFKFVVSGNGYYIYLRYWEKWLDTHSDQAPHYLGVDNIDDGACVWMNKTVSENKAILWNKTSASEPTSTSGNGEWTTLTSQGTVYSEGDSSYLIDDILAACGSSSKAEFNVQGNDHGYVNIIPLNQYGPIHGEKVENHSSNETLIVDKSKLQAWKEQGYTKVYMQNASTSVKVRGVN